jgi:hypothetical protein
MKEVIALNGRWFDVCRTAWPQPDTAERLFGASLCMRDACAVPEARCKWGAPEEVCYTERGFTVYRVAWPVLRR